MSHNWAGGSTRGWRKIRAYVLARDQHQCQVRIPGVCTTRATCVHHTRGKAHGDDPAYLQASCDPCNARVNDPGRTSLHQQLVEWIRARPTPASTADVRARFPHATPDNVRRVLSRALQRGELTSAGRGRYRAGPTGLPPTASDPLPQPRTRW